MRTVSRPRQSSPHPLLLPPDQVRQINRRHSDAASQTLRAVLWLFFTAKRARFVKKKLQTGFSCGVTPREWTGGEEEKTQGGGPDEIRLRHVT